MTVPQSKDRRTIGRRKPRSVSIPSEPPLAVQRLSRRIAQLKSANSAAEERKEWAWQHAAEVYRERDLLVAVLARLLPSHVMEMRGGRVAVCIHTTTAGQLAWTFPRRADGTEQAHSSTLYDCLADLPTTPNDWDGAKTADRFERLERLARSCTLSTASP